MPQPNSGNQPDSVVEPNQAHGNLHKCDFCNADFDTEPQLIKH